MKPAPFIPEKTYMERCLQLAETALGHTAPNPMVGCVIVHENKIIGEGYHQLCGQAHAEVNAINSVADQLLLQESTLYVNLEPCVHFGKTPPCTKLIIEKKIPRVVVGMTDPNPLVSGKGMVQLREAGVEVIGPFMEDEAKWLNRRFISSLCSKRPYVILKWAETLDGFIDVLRNPDEKIKPTWITNETARILVHKWRAEEQAIMVGSATVVYDNPQLTVRNWVGKNPLRVFIDRNLKISNRYNIFDKSAPTRIYNLIESKKEDNIEYIKLENNKNIIGQILEDLNKQNIQSLIVEGGSKLLSLFIEQQLWDEARIFTGNKHFGQGVAAPEIRGRNIFRSMIGDATWQVILPEKK
jgi:diaminohydroxyphosphoribosylaminopyrimidine deaminase / 5-amino-6-(5-phosphoribosylamino)uracil reductase